MNPDPVSGSPEWQQIKAQFPVGTRVRGTVTQHVPFGIFLDLGGATGVVLIVDFVDEGRMTVEQYPPISSSIEAVVIWHVERPQPQIRLSMKPSALRDAK